MESVLKVIIYTIHDKYTVGYLRYGKTNIYADIGEYDSVFKSLKRKHLNFLSKYMFYGKI